MCKRQNAEGAQRTESGYDTVEADAEDTNGYLFMRGSSNLTDVVEKRAKAKTRVIKSQQGFTCYLLIIDAKTRYIWAFLLKSKHSPSIALVDTFLANHGRHDNVIRTIWTDSDGALAQSPKFRVMTLHKHGYIVESTGPDGSSANGMAERPHKTLTIMVCCMFMWDSWE